MLEKKTIKFYIFITSLLFIPILTCILFFNMTTTSYLINWEQTVYVADSTFLNILYLLILLLSLIYFCKSKVLDFFSDFLHDESHFKHIKFLLLGVIFFLCCLWAVCTQFIPGVDEGEVQLCVSECLKKNYSSFAPGGYMARYACNRGLFLFEYVLGLFFGSNNYFLFSLINSFAIAIVYKQLSEILKHFNYSKTSQVAIIVFGIIFFPLLAYSIYIYGNIIGLALALTSLKYLYIFFSSWKYRYAIVSTICIATAMCIKSHYQIYFVAIFLYTLLKIITLHNKGRSLCFIFFLCTGFILQAKLPTIIEERITGYKLNNSTSSWAWIAMGLQDGPLAPGWWNGYLHKVEKEGEFCVKKETELSKDSIRTSITHFAKEPYYAFNFFTKKLASTWTNPSWQCFVMVNHGSHIELPVWYNSLIHYRGQHTVIFFFNIFIIYIFLGCLVEVILNWEKSNFVDTLLIPMIFVGGFLFLLFWETKSRYALMFFVPLIAYSFMGYEKLARIICNLSHKNCLLHIELKHILYKRIFPITLAVITAVISIFVYSKFNKTVLMSDTESYKTYLKQQSVKQRKEKIETFLMNISKNFPRYTTFIAVCDEAAVSITDEVIEQLHSLGLQQSLKSKIQHGYVAVIDCGNIVYEKLADAPNIKVITEGKLDNGLKYHIESAGLPTGNFCSIIINGHQQAVNRRGLNFVVYDNELGKVVDSVAFDTWAENIPCYR